MKKTWRYKIRPLRVDGDMAFIPLTRGLEAIIDAADVPLVRDWNWSAMPADGGAWYAYCGGDRKVRLHQVILPAPPGLITEHKDRNGLNCRRANLRLATPQQNAQNRARRREGVSLYKGVSPHGANWRARICFAGRRVALGTFIDQQRAARAYDAAARKHFGEFAVLNFPDEAA